MFVKCLQVCWKRHIGRAIDVFVEHIDKCGLNASFPLAQQGKHCRRWETEAQPLPHPEEGTVGAHRHLTLGVAPRPPGPSKWPFSSLLRPSPLWGGCLPCRVNSAVCLGMAWWPECECICITLWLKTGREAGEWKRFPSLHLTCILGNILASVTDFPGLKGTTVAPGWLSRRSIRLQLRSWSCGSGVRALLWTLDSLFLSLSLPLAHSCSPSQK